MSPVSRPRFWLGVQDGTIKVFTDPVASPTGFPFKLVKMKGTIGDEEVYQSRERVCDLGYLRHAYRREDGSVGFRCPAEPQDHYTRKGGALEETVGRMCLCNGLLATAGIGQIHGDRGVEIPVLTAGDDLVNIGRFFKDGQTEYSAHDVIAWMLGEEAPVGA